MLRYLSGFDEDFYDQFDRMRREMDQLFGDWGGSTGIRSVRAGSFPPINVGATQHQVDVYVFAAGVEQDSLDVSLQQNLLTVEGRRAVELPEGAQSYRKERFNGSFRRAINLPEDLDPDKINATYRDGVLHITIQRREEVKPRQIKVQ